MNSFLILCACAHGLAAKMQAGVTLDVYITPQGPTYSVNLPWDGARFTDGSWHLTRIPPLPALIPGANGYQGEYVPATEGGWHLAQTGYSANGWLSGPSALGMYPSTGLGNGPHRIR